MTTKRETRPILDWHAVVGQALPAGGWCHSAMGTDDANGAHSATVTTDACLGTVSRGRRRAVEDADHLGAVLDRQGRRRRSAHRLEAGLAAARGDQLRGGASIPSTISTARTGPSSTASRFPKRNCTAATSWSSATRSSPSMPRSANRPAAWRRRSWILRAWQEPEGTADDTIYLVRRMHAMLMSRCLRVRFEPIVRLDQGGLFGHEMIDGLSAAPSNLAAEQRRLMQIDCQLTARLRQLQRMIAAEEAGEFSAGTHVFLPVAGSEIGSQRLIESLVDLSHVVSPNKRLVIVVPHDNVSDNAYLGQFYDRTRDLGLGMAYGECAGGHIAGEGKQANRPEFVKLARALTRGIHRAPARQQRVEAMVRDARNAGCQIIATGISCEEEAVCCRELGCHFGQGSFLHGALRRVADAERRRPSRTCIASEGRLDEVTYVRHFSRIAQQSVGAGTCRGTILAFGAAFPGRYRTEHDVGRIVDSEAPVRS